MPRPYRERRSVSGQRGFALIAIVSLIVLISTYLLVKRLNATTGFTADRLNHNAKVLNHAKQALIGYVAQQTALAGEDNPGRLPCPEPPGNYGTANEGIANGNCTLPAVGRLPWRTLGLDKLVDAAAEPLWYVVSAGWALPTSTATLTINSNTTGQLTVDGVANAAVALIIAPGAAFTVQAAAGCAARSQTHPTAGPPDLGNYLECENATSPADANFVTTGPSGSFNDQVLRVTTADLMPGIEAAIAKRIEREVVPVLKTVYADPVPPTNPSWGAGISAANPLFPYPAPFANPSTSNLQGAAVTVVGAPQGLLPFNQTQGCNPATDVRCTTTLTAWASGTPPDVTKVGGYGSFQTKTCSWQSGGNDAFCEGEYREDSTNTTGPGMVISMTATINNVAMGLRVLDTTKATIEAENNISEGAPLTIVPASVTAAMNSNGSVTITLSGTLPNIDVQGWDTWALYRIRLKRSVIGDHALLNPVDPPNRTPPGPCPVTGCTGWFVRNEWYRLLYYAPAPGHTAAALPTPSCTSGGTCLSVTNITPANKQRAILILMGRSLTNAVRPNGTLADYLEFGNADLNTTFEQRTVSRATNAPFNDRVVVLDSNP
jgi:hypothetical protein